MFLDGHRPGVKAEATKQQEGKQERFCGCGCGEKLPAGCHHRQRFIEGHSPTARKFAVAAEVPTEAPKAEAPKAEAPKAEAPTELAAEPTAAEPKAAEPAAEPMTEAPKAEANGHSHVVCEPPVVQTDLRYGDRVRNGAVEGFIDNFEYTGHQLVFVRVPGIKALLGWKIEDVEKVEEPKESVG